MDLINNAKNEVESITKESLDNKKTIDEITDVIRKLNDIKNVLEPKKKALNHKISKFNTILKSIENLKSEEILNDKDKMFIVIDKNLLDEMYLENVESNDGLKYISYNKKRVGSIEVLGDCGTDIKIRVKVYGNNDEFIVQDPYKMYSIISFINTKFNYKQEQQDIQIGKCVRAEVHNLKGWIANYESKASRIRTSACKNKLK